ncbi:hypothetical protein OIU76_006455 [Salix suchowensis]|nr:hypothetical protein OIU76_006455 [Salix suchowensis]
MDCQPPNQHSLPSQAESWLINSTSLSIRAPDNTVKLVCKKSECFFHVRSAIMMWSDLSEWICTFSEKWNDDQIICRAHKHYPNNYVQTVSSNFFLRTKIVVRDSSILSNIFTAR